jgi:hypothetical protein
MRPQVGTKVNLSRVEYIIPGNTAYQMKEYVLNMEESVKGQKAIKDFVLINKDENSMIMKYVAKMPLMTDREAIMEVKVVDVKDDDKNAILCWVKTIKHDDYPEKKKPIRMDMF